MQWLQSQAPTESAISCVLKSMTMQLCNVTECIASTCYCHALQWTPKRRHFLAAFLAAAQAAIVTRDHTRPYTRDKMLKLLDDQLTRHSSKLKVGGLYAVERDSAADDLMRGARAALAGAETGLGNEGALMKALAWTLLIGMCQQAAAEDGLQYFQTALRSSSARPRQIAAPLLLVPQTPAAPCSCAAVLLPCHFRLLRAYQSSVT